MSVKIFFSRLFHSLRREKKVTRRDKRQLDKYELKALEEEIERASKNKSA